MAANDKAPPPVRTRGPQGVPSGDEHLDDELSPSRDQSADLELIQALR
jgi:hypothetical protein